MMLPQGCRILAVLLLLSVILAACGPIPTVTAPPSATATDVPPPGPTGTATPVPNTVFYDHGHTDHGLRMNIGGDKDIEIVLLPDSAEKALRTGSGQVLPASDGNTDPDSYLQFNIDDNFLYSGQPTSKVNIIIEYLDAGTDTFNVQYDAQSGGPYGDGQFKDSMVITKGGTGELVTVVISLCDANFANRDQDADFRISDFGDGPETINRVTVAKRADSTGASAVNVDSCGANPFDDVADSESIQSCINQTCSGDTVLFTSGAGNSDYQGYIIDKTIVLVHPSAKSGLTFTSTDPDDHALLIASNDLLGFVAQLYARSVMTNTGEIDEITVRDLDFDGNRQERICSGVDQVGNGVDDNWGSWLEECTSFDDPWCSPGGLAMRGFLGQDSSHGLKVQDVTISNTECGTALAFETVNGLIDSVVIDTAGDHVHGQGCQLTDPDEPSGAWSDGITFAAFDSQLTNNTIINASDIGIVCFACTGTTIADNTIVAEEGNYGMFAGIALHPWGNSDFSGTVIESNQISNQANESCGGIHAGIDLGLHMWGAGCTDFPSAFSVGNIGACSALSPAPGGMNCDPNQPCRLWGYVPAGETLTLAQNTVSGAQVNYLVGGLEIVGQFVEENNVSILPRMTDWQDDSLCSRYESTESWGTIEFAAHDPTLAGWVDQPIYCER